MLIPRLPILGHPHLALAEQDNKHLHAKTIAALLNVGFKIDDERLVPPTGADGRAIIRAITTALQTAKSG